MKTAVFGLGYVGLPLAKLISSKGHDVMGVDVSNEKIKEAQSSGITSTNDGAEAVRSSDIILICVPTPVDISNLPDLKYVIEVCASIASDLRNEHLVIIESTIYPGVTEDVVQPILERSGLKAGKDFYLAHCPERIDPGNKKWDVSNLPRVIGGIGEKSTKKASEFYRNIIDAEILELSSVRAAEAVKIIENTFRDVNIAFVNEIAMSFDQMGIDIIEVIKGAKTKPFGFMAHYPSCGVGGHCIPVDPYYLIEKAKQKGFNHKFLSLARDINNNMPDYTVQKVIEGLNAVGLPIKGTCVCVLGLAYKKDVDDIRERPSLKIIKILEKLGAKVETYDPFFPEKSTLKSLIESKDCECIIIATDHTEFLGLDLEKGGKVKVLIDGKNCMNKDKISSNGIVYRGIGRNG